MNRRIIKVTLSEKAHQYLLEEARRKRVSLNQAINVTFENMTGEYYVMRRKHRPKVKNWSYLWTPQTAEMHDWAKALAEQGKLSGLLEGLLVRRHNPEYLGIVELDKDSDDGE